jgi:hypothetical protein
MIDVLVEQARHKIRPHTVLFENDVDTYEQHVRGQDHDRSIAEALQEAATAVKQADSQANENGGDDASSTKTDGQKSPDYLGIQPIKVSTLQKRGSGSLSTSPSPGLDLLARDNDSLRGYLNSL